MKIGLTSWTEHGRLLNQAKLSLAEYASVLPVVEVDTFFYAIPRVETVKTWIAATPESFRFVVKAFHAMTLHPSEQSFYDSEEAMYQAYFTAIEPLIRSGRLQAILFQFSSKFVCTTESILYLKRLRKIFAGYPLAIEFRHVSWYASSVLEEMTVFMQEQQFVLVTVDEPQITEKSVPFTPLVETGAFDLWRLHGRNRLGWTAKGPNWRELRTLYNYSENEISAFAKLLNEKKQRGREAVIIFNNNSGGHAAGNALQLKKELKIKYQGLNPRNMTLF